MSAISKYVLKFEEADWHDEKLLGGKGASLAQMTQIGLPVPPGFIITTQACREFYSSKKAELDALERELRRNPPPQVRDEIIKKIWKLIDECQLPQGLMDQVKEHVRWLEQVTGKRFGSDEGIPLLVSVRSGAALSMPGMMDTVLNLGLNDRSVVALARATNNEWFAYDAYRRFIQMFARIVLSLDEKPFNQAFDAKSEQLAREAETTYRDELEAIRKVYPEYTPRLDAQPPKDLAPRMWQRSLELIKELVEEYKGLVRKMWGEFPQDPYVQLELAIRAVFRSWMNPRAIFYRIANNITPDMADCTAVNVVTMVFGNMGWDSGTGVYFTRDQSSGENRPYGEFLPNAQGEDVVAGIRTPLGLEELRKRMPDIYSQLIEAGKKLEQLNRDVMDIEFTVERGKLYFLQNRVAKMTPLARVRTAVDMVKEGLITKEEAILKVDPEQVRRLLYPTIDPKVKATPIAKGLPASPGAASGQVVFNPDDAVEWAKEGKKVILVRVETKPDDVHGFYAAVGVLTSRGGMTSHAAIVARAIGKPAVVGAEAIKIDYDKKQFEINGQVFREGDWITIDGNSGNVYAGQLPTVMPEIGGELDELLRWADEFRKLGVRANADVPEDAMVARKFGAEGIGLLRIERMFRKPERLEALRKVILSDNDEEREKNMKELADMLRPDFKEMFDIMDNRPVVVRLIDPPLHEFLPSTEELLSQIHELEMRRQELIHQGKEGEAKELDPKLEELRNLYSKVKALQEANPMMGHRGVRVGVTYPVIYYHLTRAIAEAAAELIKEGKHPIVEIMIPQVSDVSEIRYVKNNAVLPAIQDVENEYGVKLNFKIGTMIETVRACLTAREIANEVDFFSFGTNDLTQATFSFSRDDVENKFMAQYLDKGILPADPFETVDVPGVGRLIQIATKEGKEANRSLEVGVCGEHGGDPASIKFFHSAGVDYVSASPYRVPVARLAAAQAAVAERLGAKGKSR